MEYKISNLASHDLEEIWLYTYENWSHEQADSYLNLIINEIELLARNPNLGNDFGYVRKGYYSLKIKSHIIFYRVDKKEHYLEIIRILHQRMDIENRLQD